MSQTNPENKVWVFCGICECRSKMTVCGGGKRVTRDNFVRAFTSYLCSHCNKVVDIEDEKIQEYRACARCGAEYLENEMVGKSVVECKCDAWV